MRLLKRLVGVEASGAAAARVVAGRVGLVYSAGDVRVMASQLEPGELIACDMHQVGEIACDMPEVRMVERVTVDAEDLGFVFDRAGRTVGRVTRIEGSLIEWVAWRPAAPGPASAAG